jgi:hypothetical protein
VPILELPTIALLSQLSTTQLHTTFKITYGLRLPKSLFHQSVGNSTHHQPSRFPLAFSINHIQEAFLLGSHCCQLSHHDSQTVTRFENPKTASSSQGIGSCSESKPACFAEDRKEKGDVSSVVQGRQ